MNSYSYPWPPILLAVLLFLGLAMTPPIRAALRDGWRCLHRYPIFWQIPAGFGMAYALFQSLTQWMLQIRLEQDWRTLELPQFRELPDPFTLWQASWLPALEHLAAITNCLVETFPISALLALGFLGNYGGYAADLARALRRRLKPGLALLIQISLGLCAFLSLAKPAAFLVLPELSQYFTPPWLIGTGILISAGSFVFEYLLGVTLQVFLIITALTWIRGAKASASRRLHFTMSRLGFVLKWALAVAIAAGVLVYLPMMIWALQAGYDDPDSFFANYTQQIARPILAILMVATCTVQITLALHNESLRQALRDHGKFVGRNWPSLGGLLVVFFLLFLFAEAGFTALRQVSHWVFLFQIPIGLAHALLLGVLGGWTLASWVCYYRSHDGGRSKIEF